MCNGPVKSALVSRKILIFREKPIKCVFISDNFLFNRKRESSTSTKVSNKGGNNSIIWLLKTPTLGWICSSFPGDDDDARDIPSSVFSYYETSSFLPVSGDYLDCS
ncbi:unnamed protein product [Hermetia illucens]|uniref:Uncharacterized protein n=1 Tax=Hermetia illucens TaxID=343691 RepID=A0A7R8YTH5_HERIL|nr:unnamed protein product [Hermetia illucens]